MATRKRLVVRCPAWLEKDAQSEWKRLVAEGTVEITPANLSTVAGYCQAFARWKAAERDLTENGTELASGDGPSPQIAIAMKYFDRMLKAAGLLGLSIREVRSEPRPVVLPEPSSDVIENWFGEVQ